MKMADNFSQTFKDPQRPQEPCVATLDSPLTLKMDKDH